MKTQNAETKSDLTDAESEQWLDMLRRQVASMKFGVVQITVHDSKVVQLEKTEKIRFQQPKS
ncbi:MAG: YezD family protein [Verrucomicrobiota bacterium]